MPSKATREYQARLNDVKRTYTGAVLRQGPTLTQLRRASVQVKDMVAAEVAAGREVDARWLVSRPEFRRLAATITDGAVAKSTVAEQLLPDLITATRDAAAVYVDAYGLDARGGADPVHEGRAAAYLTERRRGLVELPDKLAGLIADDAARPVKPFTTSSVLSTAQRRLTAETQHTLTVMSTETANAGREVIAAALGPDGVWRWVTSGDDRVCDYCGARDGQMFLSTQIFTEPHVRCRCVSEPA